MGSRVRLVGGHIKCNVFGATDQPQGLQATPLSAWENECQKGGPNFILEGGALIALGVGCFILGRRRRFQEQGVAEVAVGEHQNTVANKAR
jgi:hypothetical protein